MDAVGFLMDDAELLYLDEIDCDARNAAESLAFIDWIVAANMSLDIEFEYDC